MKYIWLMTGVLLLAAETLHTSKIVLPRVNSFGNVSAENPTSFLSLSREYTDTQYIEDRSGENLPYFENHQNSSDVTVQLGSTTFLKCSVKNLQDKTVSWLRRIGNDLHLLTFGLHTYSSDERYSLIYERPNTWKLQIKFANKRDEGIYECRVSSEPPIGYYVHLSVVVPQVRIVDENHRAMLEKFYKAGSSIGLMCIISRMPQPSLYITWKHGNRILNYDTSRRGVSVKMETVTEGAISRLRITSARIQDSGNYTCAVGDITAASIMVHVLNGEAPAAMQHDHSSGTSMNPISWTFMPVYFLHCYIQRAHR